MHINGNAKNGYVPGIDGLRAFAVLSVVLYHLDEAFLPGGFTGVDIFFVISGYVISKSLATTEASNFKHFILGFYKRRILRIVPALLICLLATSVLTSLFVPDGWLSRFNNWSGLWAFLGVSNFYLVGTADGYFADGIPFNPYVHTWSLAVEEQFYVIFPIVFYLWIVSASNEKGRSLLHTYSLLVLIVASLLFSIYETHADQLKAFYLLPSRFWELAMGAWLYQQQSDGRLLVSSRKQADRLLWVGFVLMFLGFVFAKEHEFPFPWALLPVGAAFLIIMGTVSGHAGTVLQQGVLQQRSLIYIGRISYSLYLWHWPVFALFRWTVGLTELWHMTLAMLLTFALAIASYHYVERVIRSNKTLIAWPEWRVITLGVSAMLFAFLGTAAMFKYDDQFGLKQTVTADMCTWQSWFIDGCEVPEVAALGADTGDKQLFVFGDSHAGAYAAMLRHTGQLLDVKIQQRGRGGCPVAKISESDPDGATCYPAGRDAPLVYLQKNAKPGDLVFLPSLRIPRLGGHHGALDLDAISQAWASDEREAAFEQGYQDAALLIKQMQELGLHVLLEAPKPLFQAPPYRCADWFNRSNPVCEEGFEMSRDFLLQHRDRVMQAMHGLQQEVGVHIWDPFPLLCDSPVCSAFKDEKPLFVDGDHLSGYANRMLLPSFIATLDKIWQSETR